jgi:hypothetical protein
MLSLLIYSLTSQNARTFCAFDSELDQYSMNTEAKEMHAVLSIVQVIALKILTF